MGNIHQRAQQILGTLWSISRFGGLIDLISPSGEAQSDIPCGVLYTQSEVDRNGFNTVKNNPRVDIRMSDLTVIPAPNEKWIVKIPTSKTDPTKISHTIEGKPIRNDTHGIISLKLKKVIQQ